MKFRFLTPRIHGALDYAAAAGLIVLPFLLDIGAASPLAQWISVAAGAGLIGYSLLTDYAFGALPVLSFRGHLLLDGIAALAFFVAPFVFGWQGLVMGYYFVMGGGVVLVVALSTGSESPSPGERSAVAGN